MELGSSFPLNTPSRTDAQEAAREEIVQSVPGEVSLDVIKAQCLAPQVRKRIIELEDCLWALAEHLGAMANSNRNPCQTCRDLIERAKLLLKERLEVDCP